MAVGVMPQSLDHWDMRTGRNISSQSAENGVSLDHWDMRTGRNTAGLLKKTAASLDHWDMRTGRNSTRQAMQRR